MHRVWQLAVVCIVIAWSEVVLAQRRPIADDTLGNERSLVIPVDDIRGLPGDLIQGGARRGNNLFHSFQEFNVEAERAVYFDDPGVQNILGRVTGGNGSDIQGRLGVLGNANLFLINPNGIVFGEGASLDVGGSFVATTADAIQFGDQGFFNVADPTAPPLLTVQPSAFLFNQIQTGTIENQSFAFLGDDGLGNEVLGLQVPNGENLVLLGGNIINSGDLNAFGGRVELGSVAGTGTVELNDDGSLNFPDNLTRADVLINNDSRIDVAFNNGGDIAINARNINVLEDSLLRAGIFSELGSVNSQAGNITLNATDAIQIRQSSLITNNVGAGARGSGGNIDIITDSLFVTNGSELQAITYGEGDAGDVVISARDRVLFNDGNAFSTVGSVDFDRVAVGEGGDVVIRTDVLEVVNGAQLQASTFGIGDAGDVVINARDRVLLARTSADGLPSAIFSDVDGNGNGRGGNITINTNLLELRNGARLSTSTLGIGNAGNVIITAGDRVLLDASNIFSRLEEGGEGRGGSIAIDTGSLVVRNGAALTASTRGQGNAGNVVIDARDRVLFDDGSAFSSVGSEGFNGRAVGEGGDVRIRTNVLEVINGAQLEASTFGIGNAGTVVITARDRVLFDDGSAFSSVGSEGFNGRAVGEGGDVRIRTDVLEVINGAQLQASTYGQGGAGNVVINARDRVLLNDSHIFTRVEEDGIGRGGNITIDTDSLAVINGAALTASTDGWGRAGNIQITTDTLSLDGVGNDGRSSGLFTATFSTAREQGGDIIIDASSVRITDGAVINAETENRSRGGNVTLNANVFEATGGGQIITTASSSGRAGNITFNVSDRMTLTGFDPNYGDRLGQFGEAVISNQGETSGLFANTADNSSGRGGTIRITTGELDVSDRARIAASSQGIGVAGNINISAQSVQLDRGNVIAETSASADGGNIRIQGLDLLQLRNGSRISATAGTAQSEGNGGNIRINSDFIVAVPNENSDIRANAFAGNGGNIDITTEGLFGIEPRDQPTELSDITASSNLGIQGNIEINRPDVDPSRGLAELPDDVVDASQQVAQTCPTDGDVAGEVGSFFITGRGGVPANPADLLGGETVLGDLAVVEESLVSERRESVDDRPSITPSPSVEMVEAQGWSVNAEGKVVLTVETNGGELPSSAIAPASCPSS